MRKLYNEFFYIPKQGKIREKVMLARVITTVTIVIICLVAMSFTAYAYFSHNITSGSNIIKAANFDANISITNNASKGSTVSITNDGESKTANLEAGKYTVELTKGSSTANKGFCIITIGDKDYYTDQIGVDTAKNLDDAKVKFELRLSAPTKIKVVSHWGTSVYYDYEDADRAEVFITSGDILDFTTKTESGSVTKLTTSGNGNTTAPTPSEPTDATESTNTTENTESVESTESTDGTKVTKVTEGIESRTDESSNPTEANENNEE
ncbi:MAG: hypothetical protein IJC36_01175 [Clostridia bacterium]|nr:hypothetical protein [Clostridia bacterium]